MAQNPESWKKLFDVILEKLVATPSVEECKREYALLFFTVKDDKSSLQRFDIDNTYLIGCFLRDLSSG